MDEWSADMQLVYLDEEPKTLQERILQELMAARRTNRAISHIEITMDEHMELMRGRQLQIYEFRFDPNEKPSSFLGIQLKVTKP